MLRLRELEAYDNDEFPVDARQRRLVPEYHFVARANDREFVSWATAAQVLHYFLRKDLRTLLDGAMVHDDGNRWRPFLEFVHPVGQSAQRGDDEMRTEVAFLFAE